MAIIDKRLSFSEAQTLTASGVSTNTVDLTAGIDIGPGTPMVVDIVLGAAPASTGTYTAALQTDDNSGFTSPATVATVTIPATAKAGDHFPIAVPPAIGVTERYLRVNYTLGGTSPSLTVTAHLTAAEIQANRVYPAPAQA